MNTTAQQPAPRRSLTAAIAATSSLPQEALDLIRAGTPQPKATNPVIAPKPIVAEIPVAAAVAPTPVAAPVAEIPAPEKAPRTVVRAKAKVEEVEELDNVEEVVTLVQDTYRLPSKYLEALATAGFQRKTKRLRPFTKQDIVATALADWLIKKGFLEESDR